MTRAILLFTAIAIASANGGTIGTLKATQEPSDANRNVSKRDVLEFYPDWVPFKNKHGDELGEFVDVNKPKAKVKKRLALPMNFLMRAVSDDLEDLGQGESDNDDEYYKKDTTDNTGEPVISLKTSDIDGLIQIITQDTPSLADDINKSIPKPSDRHQAQARDNAKVSEGTSEEVITTTPEPKVKVEEESKWTDQSEEDYEEDTESTTTTKKPELSEEEQKENEMRKKLILDSVDELKYRHEKEQRAISEKAKYEDRDAHDNATKRAKITTSEYDEYEDSGSTEDKYPINVERQYTTKHPTTQSPLPKTTKALRKKPEKEDGRTKGTPEKTINSQQYSVFKNPNLYTVDYEDVDEDRRSSRTTPLPRRFSSKPRRFSSKYVATPPKFDSEENNVYPTRSSTEGTAEPILYFPKMKPKKKPKKSKYVSTTTPAPDTYVAETVEDKLINKQTTLPITYPTSTDVTWTVKKEVDAVQDTTVIDEVASPVEAIETGPSEEAASSNSESVTDAVPASSDHAKEEPKDYHVEKGEGHEHHSSHEEEHEEHGKKAYEGLHKDSKTKKGHHDKEDHLGKYEDRGGHDKKHHDESGHYGAHHHEEHGKKHAKYEESGKHSKGHSTKGSHDIHKKEEYEKKVEFFEEEGDSAEEEKHGGHHNEKEHKAGGHFKKGNLLTDHDEKKKGESGHFEKGGHHDVHKGHKSSGGHDSHGRHGGAHHAAGGHQSGKKWVYHHGYPAKNANLIVIDRRADRYMNGPSYYG